MLERAGSCASDHDERDLTALGPSAVVLYRDVVVVAEAVHSLLGPSVAIPRRLARTTHALAVEVMGAVVATH
jgi:hypothetical protein